MSLSSAASPLRKEAAADIARGALETARLAVCVAVEGVAEGLIDVGVATPLVAPVFVALQRAKWMIDAMEKGREDLARLHKQCTLITTRIIVRCNQDSNHGIDVTPLKACVDDIYDFAKTYNGRGLFRRVVKMRGDNGKIEELRETVGYLLKHSTLESSVRTAEDVAALRLEVAKLTNLLAKPQAGMHNTTRGKPVVQPEVIKLASVPKDRPADKAWHVVRGSLVKKLYEGLSKGSGPQLVGLVGRSGSGKTTCAAAVVGDPAVAKLCGVENMKQALVTLNCVRAYFCDGVVWLHVGRRGGSPERLPALMSELAKVVHEGILKCDGYRPGASPHNPLDGSAYVLDAMINSKGGGEKMRCLVVADDVWELQVLEELQRTGMSVLVTTRNEELVRLADGTVLVVDQLTDTEAEFVLRGAAELPAGARFPAAAKQVFDRCDRMAMHLEFVGRWSNVRGGVEEEGWTEAVNAIDAEIEAVRKDTAEKQGDPFETRRVAILRAGFRYLAALDENNRILYLALAAMPDGHAFVTKEAAVLLFDDWDTEYKVKKAARVVGALEQWAVVRMEGSLYRMHDAHIKFAKSKLIHIHNEDVREPVARRWRDHLSSLDAVVAVGDHTLRELWGALGSAGGDSWQDFNPYDAALAVLDDSDPSCLASLEAVVSFYCGESEWAKISPVARRLLRVQESRGDKEGIKSTLVMLIHSANGTGRVGDGDELRSRLYSMLDFDAIEKSNCVQHDARCVARTLHDRGGHLDITRRYEEARDSFKRALAIQEQHGESFSISKLEVAETFEGLAAVLNNLCLKEEAVEAYWRSLSIKEEVLGYNSSRLTVTMHNLAASLSRLGRISESADFLQRALSIEEARGPDNMGMYRTMRMLAHCLQTLDRQQEATSLLERARRVENRSAATSSA